MACSNKTWNVKDLHVKKLFNISFGILLHCVIWVYILLYFYVELFDQGHKVGKNPRPLFSFFVLKSSSFLQSVIKVVDFSAVLRPPLCFTAQHLTVYLNNQWSGFLKNSFKNIKSNGGSDKNWAIDIDFRLIFLGDWLRVPQHTRFLTIVWARLHWRLKVVEPVGGHICKLNTNFAVYFRLILRDFWLKRLLTFRLEQIGLWIMLRGTELWS